MKTFSEREILNLSSWLEGQREFVFLDTSRPDEENMHSYLFLHPIRWISCRSLQQVSSFFLEIQDAVDQGYHVAGWFAYELGCCLEPSLFSLCNYTKSNGPVAVLGVFDSPVVFDHSRDIGDAMAQVTGGRTFGEQKYTIRDLQPNIDKQEYRQAIKKIRQYLTAGDTYQVNYTFKLLFGMQGSPASFYRSLRRNQSVSYGAWIRCGGRDIMSFSPELFFRDDMEKVTVKPMKGTLSRGKTINEDVPRRQALREDVKNISENVMIVDLLRNDLGHLLHESGGGEVKPRSLCDVEAYETVLQMTSTIDGIRHVRQKPDMLKIFKALFPCGSVTGAPKIRTMEIIHELEREPRGVYCGAIGYCCGNKAVFNVPIRTVAIEDGKGEMGVGSGIVFDSDVDAEWEECILKGEFFARPRPSFQLIETLLWCPESGFWLFREHMERLEDSAAYFFFRYDRQRISGLLTEKSRGFSQYSRVRLLLDRDGNVEIAAIELGGEVKLRTEPDQHQGKPARVCFSEKRTDPADIHLYHKTTCREMYTEEREKALANGYDEVLFMNTRDEVTEGSITNIFLLEKGRLVTPPVSCGLLSGTFRRSLLDKGAAAEKILTKKSILEADRVYIGNSVRGLVEVEVEI